MGEFEDRQSRIDAMFEAPAEPSSPVHERICTYAKRGVDAPESLTLHEIRQVCYALVVHYAQMGIG